MKLSIYGAIMGAAAGLLLLAPRAFAQPAQRMPAGFQVLLQRSIFSREALRPEDRRSSVVRLGHGGPGGPPVFIGAILDDRAQCVAFIEDPQTGNTALVAAGQRLEQGTTRLGSVEQVTLDYMTLRPEGAGASRRIEVGQTLTGEARADLASAASGDTTTDSTGATTAATPGGSGLDPREILRQRRLRELQGH